MDASTTKTLDANTRTNASGATRTNASGATKQIHSTIPIITNDSNYTNGTASTSRKGDTSSRLASRQTMATR